MGTTCKSKLSILLSLIVFGALGSASAQADDDARQKGLEQELAIQKAKNELMAARYPAFEEGKTGAVAGSEKLAGMAYQHLPRATTKVAEIIATGLKNDTVCVSGTIVLDGRSVSEKVAMAFSFENSFRQIDADIATELKAQSVNFSAVAVAPVVTAIGALASYMSIFKTDYTVANSTLDIDRDWLIASIVMKGDKIESERFPNRQAVFAYADKVEALKLKAGKIKDVKKKKALSERIEALRLALFKPDASGVLPLITTALLSPMATPGQGKCLAFVSSTNASPLLLTKDGVFSKGGKAYLHVPVSASVVQMNNNGQPIATLCGLATVSAPIVLKTLTRTDPGPIPWSSERVAFEGHDCSPSRAVTEGKGTAPAPQEKDKQSQ